MSEEVFTAIRWLPHRQRVLLCLLRAFGGKMGERDFQRLLFDYSYGCQERGADAPYDFIAHELGPRSFTAVADRNRLARRGIFAPGAWHLTAEGHRLSERIKNRDVAVFAARIQNQGNISETDGNRKILADDRDDATSDSRSRNKGLLVTIGYEGRSYESYFNELLKIGVSRLCDVRRNPRSRKWGFSKRLLSQGCDELGIRYKAFPELGIESGQRTDLRNRAAYNALFAHYEATTLPRYHDSVVRIAGWIDEGERVAITCYERDSRDCHRSCVATAVVKIAAKSRLLRHL